MLRRRAVLGPCIGLVTLCLAVIQAANWVHNIEPRLHIQYGEVETTHRFLGNESHKDHFKLLEKDHNSLLVGARNIVYNISLKDLSEFTEQRIEWHSSASHQELCYLKGKSEDDCQNYIRVLAKIAPDRLLICGSNAYKPYCRNYRLSGGDYVVEKEFEGRGLCPFDPDHNSTAVYSDGQLYTATVADFSGGDPLVYREPLRTERSDLKQLNGPSFVNSMAYDDFIFFFFRETAVEYMNCGKKMYSRVARVCKHDKGGPHQFGDRWTSFLKSRLNCSVPGEYPFYFDEIQSMSDMMEGVYGEKSAQLMYGVFSTPSNSIGGSAVCAFSMQSILDTFEGPFKEQETMNANWLPVPTLKVPEPRPGQCVNDSRTLPDVSVNFVKSHTLMDMAVPAFFSRPVLVRISSQMRFTMIAVDSQVPTPDGRAYDVLFIGTDDGKIVKAVNAASFDAYDKVDTVVIEEIQVLPPSVPIKNLYVVHDKLVVLSDDEILSVALHRCNSDKVTSCSECLALQDPYCSWDMTISRCVSREGPRWAADKRRFVQNVAVGFDRACPHSATAAPPPTPIPDSPLGSKLPSAVQASLVIYTAETLGIAVATSVLAALVVGFVGGFLFSRRCRHDEYSDMPRFPDSQRHQLNRLTDSGLNADMPQPINNKAINLVLNVPPKNANGKNANSSAENKPIQKVKKTYI